MFGAKTIVSDLGAAPSEKQAIHVHKFSGSAKDGKVNQEIIGRVTLEEAILITW